MKRIILEKMSKIDRKTDKIIILSYDPEKWLAENGYKVVEMPCWTQYEKENDFYREVAVIAEGK